MQKKKGSLPMEKSRGFHSTTLVTEIPDFAELRQHLANEPSAANWRALCTLFEAWPEETRDIAVSYARPHLQNRPDELRSAPRTWWHLPLSAMHWSLIRSFCLWPEDWMTKTSLGGRGPHSLLPIQTTKYRDLSLLSKLTILELRGRCPQTKHLRHLLQHDRFRQLRWLRMRQLQLDAEQCQILLESPALASLQALDIAENGLNATTFHAIASATMHDLRVLDLSNNRIQNQGLQQLLEAPVSQTLEYLDCSHNGLWYLGALLLAESPNTQRLTHLQLQNNHLHSNGVQALTQSPFFSRLTHLNLSENAIEREGSTALFRSQRLPELRQLDLSKNPLQWEETDILERSPFPHLEHLSLHFCQVAPDLTAGLLQQHPFPKLRRLELSALSELPPAHQWSGTWPSSLSELSLGQNALDAQQLHDLLENQGFAQLQRLSLGANLLLEEGANVIFRSSQLQQLTHLDLMDNQIWPKNPNLWAPLPPSLTHLDLSFNPIGPQGLANLLEARSIRQLKSWQLHQVQIEDFGFQQLLRGLPFPQLHTLGLSFNQLTLADIDWEQARNNLPQLRHLDLSSNPLSPHSLERLFQHTPWNLSSLSLANTNLTEATLQLLQKTPWIGQLHTLDLRGNNTIRTQQQRQLLQSPHLRFTRILWGPLPKKTWQPPSPNSPSVARTFVNTIKHRSWHATQTR